MKRVAAGAVEPIDGSPAKNGACSASAGGKVDPSSCYAGASSSTWVGNIRNREKGGTGARAYGRATTLEKLSAWSAEKEISEKHDKQNKLHCIFNPKTTVVLKYAHDRKVDLRVSGSEPARKEVQWELRLRRRLRRYRRQRMRQDCDCDCAKTTAFLTRPNLRAVIFFGRPGFEPRTRTIKLLLRYAHDRAINTFGPRCVPPVCF
jgi:hypothetical protein